MKYSFKDIEEKWQKFWEEKKINEPDLRNAKNPFYNLMMFPYPSAEGLHVGNLYAFTGSDIYGRFKRMQGYDVFEPIGFDAFGIHSENYAIKTKRHPSKLIPQNIANFTRQLKKCGLMLKTKLAYAGYNVFENNDPVAGQEIPHLHFHVIPRIAGDNLPLWRKEAYAPGEAEAICSRLKAVL